MRAFTLLSSRLVGLVAVSMAAVSTPGVGADLRGLWRFDEASGDTATDASGVGNNGTLVGQNGNVPTRVSGQPGFGGALRFTNNFLDRAYVQVPGSPALKVGLTAADAWSFTCWGYEASDGAGNYVAYYGRFFTQDDGRGLQWESGAAGDSQFYVWEADLPAWQIGLGFSTPVVPVFDQWVHWALVYDGSNLTMYRNGNDPVKGGGKVTVPVSASLAIANYSGALTIGSQVDYGVDASRTWNGMLDDFAIFGGALTESEVRTVMTGDFSAYLNAKPPSIVGQPASTVINQGLDASLSVAASSQSAMTYQWRFNGKDLAGATTSALALNNIQSSQAGTYTVLVRNASGSTLSSGATITVLVPLPPQLVGLWRFDEGSGTNVADSSGLTNNGSLVALLDQTWTPGTGLPTWVPSRTGFGTALQFLNSGEYNFAYIPASESLKIGLTANDTWSITAWTKELSDGFGGYVARYGRLFAYDDGWGLNFDSGYNGDSEYWIWHNSPGVWQQPFGTSAAVVPILDEWVHLALVYDGRTLTLYRNGNLAAQNGGKTSLPANGSVAFTDHGGYLGALEIGSVVNEPVDHNWNGMIDDFAVFTGALTEAQVQTVMGGNFAGFENQQPALAVYRSGGQVVIAWGFGTLQSKATLTGTWMDVAGVQSPLIIEPTEAAQFYRVKR